MAKRPVQGRTPDGAFAGMTTGTPSKLGSLLMVLSILSGCATAGASKENLETSAGGSAACLEKLRGYWEGSIDYTVKVGSDWYGGVNRTLRFEVINGTLIGFYGITGLRLDRVDLSVEFLGRGCAPKIFFRTPAGANVTLYLVRDDWLRGDFLFPTWDPKAFNFRKRP